MPLHKRYHFVKGCALCEPASHPPDRRHLPLSPAHAHPPGTSACAARPSLTSTYFPLASGTTSRPCTRIHP
eukprot:4406749-Pleurochrysis_carterae.AAC.1